MSVALDYKNEFAELSQALDAQGAICAQGTDWLSTFRFKSRKAFQAMPTPNRKVEHYKYNSLSFFQKHPFAGFSSDFASEQKIDLPDMVASAQRLVFIDGTYSSAHSQNGHYSLTAFSEANSEQQALILEYMNKSFSEKSFFRLMNDALTQDGLLIEVPESAQPEPLHLIFITTQGGVQKTSVSNIIMHLKKYSKVTLVEHHITQADLDQPAMANHVIQFVVDESASLDHHRLHLENSQQVHFGELLFWLQGHANLNSFHLGFGSILKRIDLNVCHQSPGSTANISGVYLATEQQQIDYHTNIQHRAPHCTSHEVFRGILGGAARAVFNGRIHIFPDAQKTLAQLNNRNLLLSERAEVNTKPELEIYADDVQCAHGATVSQMDDTALFYLRSRGIPIDQAKLILSFGFINELINDLENPDLEEYLRPRLIDFFEQVN